MPDPIAITIKLFAVYQEVYGASELVLDFPAGTTVAQVLDRLITAHPELEQWRDVTRFGVNLRFVEADTVIEEGDEVVLIPPVSGG
jgi:molybdopterin synthase sulfur carrier subunit